MATAAPRGVVGRKPEAKLRPEEHESHEAAKPGQPAEQGEAKYLFGRLSPSRKSLLIQVLKEVEE